MSHVNDTFNKNNVPWNHKISSGFYGGLDRKSNLSKGYHGILIQWLNHYNKGKNILLVSESNQVKNEFKQEYPQLNFYTIDFFPELQTNEVDYKFDICNMDVDAIDIKFDVILNQATLEHVYDPFTAMKNLTMLLNKDGVLLTHTHPPGFGYHQHPRDYIRFMKDWWYDFPKLIGNEIELLQLVMWDNKHVFTCYKKIF